MVRTVADNKALLCLGNAVALPMFIMHSIYMLISFIIMCIQVNAMRLSVVIPVKNGNGTAKLNGQQPA